MGRYKLAQPVHQRKSFFEELTVFQWQVSLGDGGAPFKLTTIRLQIAIDDLKEVGNCQRVFTQEGNLLAFIDAKRGFVKQLSAIGTTAGQILHIQNLVAHIAQWLKNNARI